MHLIAVILQTEYSTVQNSCDNE